MLVIMVCHRVHMLTGAGRDNGDWVVATHSMVEELKGPPKWFGFDACHEVIYAKVVKVPPLAQPKLETEEDREDREEALRIITNAAAKPHVPEGRRPEVAEIVLGASASTLGSHSPLPQQQPPASQPQQPEMALQPGSLPQPAPKPAPRQQQARQASRRCSHVALS